MTAEANPVRWMVYLAGNVISVPYRLTTALRDLNQSPFEILHDHAVKPIAAQYAQFETFIYHLKMKRIGCLLVNFHRVGKIFQIVNMYLRVRISMHRN